MTISKSLPPRTDLMRWDEEADEPYILLPSHPDLRLTPWRETDVDDAMKLYNDPSIAKYSFRRPYPYRKEDFGFLRNVVLPPATETISTVLRPLLAPPAQPTHPLPSPSSDSPLPFFPFIIIRHHPSGRMIGDMAIFQPMRSDVSAADAKAAFGGKAKTSQTAAEQTWEMAYNLMPEWTGKGIGGRVLDCVLEVWVKWVGIGTMMAGAETANVNSSALVKSRGFVKVRTFIQEWPEDKGGGEREISHWELKMADHISRLGPAKS